MSASSSYESLHVKSNTFSDKFWEYLKSVNNSKLNMAILELTNVKPVGM